MREIVSPRIDEQHRRHVEIGNEINRLKSELDNLKNNYINPKEFKENASVVLRALQKLSPIKQKEVISALIDKIMVYPGKLKLFFFRMKSRLRLVDALPGEDWFEERLQCGAKFDGSIPDT